MSIEIQEFEKIAEQIANLRSEEARLSQEKKQITDQLELTEKQMIDMLTQENLKSYHAKAGTLSISYRSSVKTPKLPSERTAFFNYLKEKGVYDSMVSVNSMTLNSWYKKELEAAVEAGNDNFAVPGIEGVTLTETLNFRRA
jgi:hypothetical protein